MRILIALVLALFTSPVAVSQTTWNGLRFGMSVKETQDVMASKGTTMVATDAQTLKSANDFDLMAGTYAFPLIVKFHFDTTGLSTIELDLDVQEYRKHQPTITSDTEAVWLFGSFSFDALMEKYGKPMTQENDCKPMPSSPSWTYGCSAHWRVDGQIIGFDVDAITANKSVLIVYRPQPTQL